MQVSINVPDSFPSKWLRDRIKEIEISLKKEARALEKKKRQEEQALERHDPWRDPDTVFPSVDTGIEDLSINHDHYLYGVSKRL